MIRIKNMTGLQFGRLNVVAFAGLHEDLSAKWLCVCSCGNSATVRGASLRSGRSKSCGCLKKEIASVTFKRVKTTHGKSGSEIYEVWKGIIKRCKNKNKKDFNNYGGRGITVCDRWLDFDNFYSDMGEKPEGMSIDRINNDGNYEPQNCRWATRSEQSRNKRNNRWFTLNGKTMTLADWADSIGISHSSLSERLEKYTEEEALTMPKMNNINRKSIKQKGLTNGS